MAEELKRRGFRFVGPTTAYALMQATGHGRRPCARLLGAPRLAVIASAADPGAADRRPKSQRNRQIRVFAHLPVR